MTDNNNLQQEIDRVHSNNTEKLLRNYIGKIENIEEQVANLNLEKKAVYDDIKYNGFDVRVTKEIIKERKKNPEVIEEIKTIKEQYYELIGK
jgi:uncharacterized protein (UPF0335 family)